MARGDIQPFDTANARLTSAVTYMVQPGRAGADGTVSRIQPGEPVIKLAGATGVIAAVTSSPTSTLRIVGVAASTSTETASATGIVTVVPATNGQIWMVAPATAASWDTQTEYNALVGARVLLQNSAGTYTILASDGAGNGCIVEYLDIAKYPGMVAFSFSPLCDYRNV